MSSHDLSLKSINQSSPIKPDSKTSSVDKPESEGFIEELKELMGLNESESAKKTTEESSDVSDKEAVTAVATDAENDDEKEESTEEKVTEGSELLSRLEQANGTLVDEESKAAASDDKTTTTLTTAEQKEGSTAALSIQSDNALEQTDIEKVSKAEDATNDENSDVLITQASTASVVAGKENSKTLTEEKDPLKEIKWDGSAKSVNAETQTKGEASGNKESTKELLTSTALIGKAEAEASKLTDAKKGKIDISALGMNSVVNGEALSLSDGKPTDSFAQQLSTAAGVTGTTQQVAAAQRVDQAAQVPLNMRHEQVSDEVAERINMMMAKNLKQIDIRLDPPEMGRMHIRLNMGSDSAGVQFTVANQQARDAIEQTLPRLREMFAQQGIQLADTSVQQQNSGNASQYGYQKEERTQGNGGFSEDTVEAHEINVQVSQPKKDGISFYA